MRQLVLFANRLKVKTLTNTTITSAITSPKSSGVLKSPTLPPSVYTSHITLSPVTATMPPSFATQHLDELVREFLLFRGFTVTYKVWWLLCMVLHSVFLYFSNR